MRVQIWHNSICCALKCLTQLGGDRYNDIKLVFSFVLVINFTSLYFVLSLVFRYVFLSLGKTDLFSYFHIKMAGI